jgi:hypothetical protein
MLMALALFSSGCSGINAGTTVSPATFLLPGILQAEPPKTNAPALLPEPAKEFASTK